MNDAGLNGVLVKSRVASAAFQAVQQRINIFPPRVEAR